MQKLSAISTRAPKEADKEAIKEKTKVLLEKIRTYQRSMYAQAKHSLLVILQGVDASGKDGAIAKVFTGVNPLGCRVYAFKAPTAVELSYDFLWRVHQQVPAKGMMQVFNRSHYEDILVPKIEGWLSEEQIRERYHFINVFERLLKHNDTHILKLYLHISPEEQKERLMERLTNPKKYWKHNDGDWQTVKKWDNFMNVYEEIFEKCNEIPWHIIPSDQNWYKEYLIAEKIVQTFEKMDLGDNH
ncbi:PPK2 family polyphosphate kinase [Thermoflexibacter ruber]|uniref:Polyphosphate:nucleotide phosphotransferase, PPK2 family n=1 Tax=Thermoflexibacter ruber TaxID=1003 RepID=A0A1I2EIY1_9BACT|nr:PPK2 family polyphosphate kinase [Thermoflexibacter ruber]SFE92486.1 polyphosphate:nucleotide phosphotransferase, PPK2 family [Thermoflexibacter ruber]